MQLRLWQKQRPKSSLELPRSLSVSRNVLGSLPCLAGGPGPLEAYLSTPEPFCTIRLQGLAGRGPARLIAPTLPFIGDWPTIIKINNLKKGKKLGTGEPCPLLRNQPKTPTPSHPAALFRDCSVFQKPRSPRQTQRGPLVAFSSRSFPPIGASTPRSRRHDKRTNEAAPIAACDN
jgi:hypothetical protein